MTVQRAVTLTDPDIAEIGTRCTVEYELQAYASNKVGTDWVMTHKRFDVPGRHEDPMTPGVSVGDKVKKLQTDLDAQRQLVAQLGTELTEKEEELSQSGSRREIEANLLRDMIDYWGHGYYVVGDGCPPSFLHKDLEELLNGVKRYGSLDEYRNRPLNDVDDAYTNDYCPDEPGNGC